MTPKDSYLTVLLIIIILTLIAFIYIQYANFNRKATVWNWLNAMAAVTIALTLNSIIPQFLVLGRTEAQCHFLHHWAGSFYHITNWLSRLYFQSRSNQIAPDTKRSVLIGRVMYGFIIAAMFSAVLMNYLRMVTMLIPPTNVCIGIPDQIVVFVFVLFLPTIIDIAINVRFFSHILRSTRHTAGTASKQHASAPIRLLKVTCLLCISCFIMYLICMAIVMGFVPLEDKSWVTVIVGTEQAYNACAMAWPAIYIFIRKWASKYINMSQTGGTSKTKPMLDSNGSKTKPLPESTPNGDNTMEVVVDRE